MDCKGEFINREGQQNISGSLKDYSSGVVGLERSLYGLINGNTDLTFFLEYAKDSRGVSAHQSNQNDVFFANRITLNDIHDTSISFAISSVGSSSITSSWAASCTGTLGSSCMGILSSSTMAISSIGSGAASG